MLAAGAVAVLAVWRLLPGSMPLYEGALPPPPYVLLGSNPPPLSASQSYPAAAAGAFAPALVETGEANVPQAEVLMTDGTFVSAAPFTVSITPVPPPRNPPAGKAFYGNVYRIQAVDSAGRTLQPVDAAHPLTIQLRAPGYAAIPTMARWNGATWVPLHTAATGVNSADTYVADSSAMGDMALLIPAGAGTASFPWATAIAVAASVVLLVVVVLGILVLRRRA